MKTELSSCFQDSSLNLVLLILFYFFYIFLKKIMIDSKSSATNASVNSANDRQRKALANLELEAMSQTARWILFLESFRKWLTNFQSPDGKCVEFGCELRASSTSAPCQANVQGWNLCYFVEMRGKFHFSDLLDPVSGRIQRGSAGFEWYRGIESLSTRIQTRHSSCLCS